MVPFVQQPTFEIASHTVHLFGPLVVFGVIIGILVARHRCKVEGLDVNVGYDLMWHAIVIGFVLSHVIDVVAYHPEQVAQNPLVLLEFWGSLSSFGGMFGGIFGMFVYFARGGRHLTVRERWAYVDTIFYGFPFAWIFGRLACTFAIDHPGRITDFPLATSLATEAAHEFILSVYIEAGQVASLPGDAVLARMGFHNLGFYEFLYTVFVMVPTMLVLGRTRRTPGFYVAAFFGIYAPIRFLADFLRVGDRTYGGLTFAQGAAVVATVIAGVMMFRLKRDVTPSEATKTL